MFKNMRVGTKIALGFVLVLVITAVVSVTAIISLDSIGGTVHKLAIQELPETSAVVETERNMWDAHVFSYEFDMKQDEKSKKAWFNRRKKAVAAAKSIIPIAQALNHSGTVAIANKIITDLSNYSKIGDEYAKRVFANKEIEADSVKLTDIIESNLNVYLSGQYRKIKSALRNNDLEQAGQRLNKIKRASHALHSLSQMVRYEYHSQLTNNEDDAAAVAEHAAEVDAAVKWIASHATGMVAKDLANNASKALTNYLENMDKWHGNRKSQADLLMRSNATAMGIIATTTAAAKQADKEVRVVGEQAASLTNSTVWLIITLAVAGIVLGALLAFFITRGITKPLNRIISTLSNGADHVASASGQVAQSSQQLAEGSSHQAASLEETTSSVEEMNSMIRANADSASQADRLMQEAKNVADQAGHSMEDMSGSMSQIAEAGNEISKIVKSIDEISFQTNLLALNAAVEAARAGEAGAGFAVVADEVRSLALRAAEAAKNTQTLVEGTVTRIKYGSEVLEKTKQEFALLAEGSGKVASLISEISTASHEQAQGIDQINQAMGQMDQVVQATAASAEESASASEEMSAQANSMLDSVHELVAMAGGAKKRGAQRASRGDSATPAEREEARMISHEEELEEFGG